MNSKPRVIIVGVDGASEVLLNLLHATIPEGVHVVAEEPPMTGIPPEGFHVAYEMPKPVRAAPKKPRNHGHPLTYKRRRG